MRPLVQCGDYFVSSFLCSGEGAQSRYKSCSSPPIFLGIAIACGTPSSRLQILGLTLGKGEAVRACSGLFLGASLPTYVSKSNGESFSQETDQIIAETKGGSTGWASTDGKAVAYAGGSLLAVASLMLQLLVRSTPKIAKKGVIRKTHLL